MPNNDPITDTTTLTNDDALVNAVNQQVTSAEAGGVAPSNTGPRKSIGGNSVFALGTRGDADTWKNGCSHLGFDLLANIREPYPTMEKIEGFLATKPNWIFMGGHMVGPLLFNDANNVRLHFHDSKVEVSVKGTKKTFSKGSEFQLHSSCQVVLWGGCSVFNSKSTLVTLRSLFGNHLLLGFYGTTGWRIVDAILKKGKENFFTRVKGNELDLEKVRDAWMESGKQLYGGGDFEEKIRAMDPDGQEWKIQNKAIVKGTKYDF